MGIIDAAIPIGIRERHLIIYVVYPANRLRICEKFAGLMLGDYQCQQVVPGLNLRSGQFSLNCNMPLRPTRARFDIPMVSLTISHATNHEKMRFA